MAYPSNSESVAQAQLRAFVERILRMKEEARAINDDIREIYAEAKANGYDKTVLGQLVTYLEKRAKDPQALAERGAIFDIYLSAYDETGTPVATHAHEDTGSVAQPGSAPQKRSGATVPESLSDASPEDRDPRAGSNPVTIPLASQANASTGNAVTTTASAVSEPQGRAPRHDGSGDASRLSEGSGSLAPIPENVVDAAPELVRDGPADARASIPQPAGQRINPATHFKNSTGLPRLHGCQDPDACAGTWRELCNGCRRVAEAA